MTKWLAGDGWLVVGEPYWKEEPMPETRAAFEIGQDFADLAGTFARVEGEGLELVEMLISNTDEWDRYTTSQWLNVSNWLNDHPAHPEAEEVRATRDASRRRYLADQRRCLGWGVFVLRP